MTRTKGDSMSRPVRVQVLMRPDDARRFERYCDAQGHKKSTLIARLIREYLEREGYGGSERRPIEDRAR
jgi:hypothetical protein